MEPNRKNKNDRELVEMALGEDQKAFEELFLRYREEVRSLYLQRTANNEQDSNDMLQETFVKIFLNLHRFNPEYSFAQWVFAIARNTFIDYTRKRKDNILSIDRPNGSTPINPPSAGPTPEESMIQRQEGRKFAGMIERLPEHYRKMIGLRFVEGYSYEQISVMTGLPLGTVKTHIHRARERLYDMIEKSGGNF